MSYTRKVYLLNKKAFHDYKVIEKWEAGISLTGKEVKSIRDGRANLKGSYVSLQGKRLCTKQFHMSNIIDDFGKGDEYRDRYLLLHKREINNIRESLKRNNGYTLVILSIYQEKNSKVLKVELALVEGKKNYDKRNDLKNKQATIDTNRALKNY